MRTVLALLICSSFSFNALAGTAFKCMGDKSRFAVVEGWYAGEATDEVLLNSSSVYGIYNRSDYGSPLTLKDDRKKRTRGAFKDYPIQYVAKQTDDLGSSTTVFAVPLGAFGGSDGKPFKALLVTDEQHSLSCEIVDSVNLD